MAVVTWVSCTGTLEEVYEIGHSTIIDGSVAPQSVHEFWWVQRWWLCYEAVNAACKVKGVILFELIQNTMESPHFARYTTTCLYDFCHGS